MDLRARKYNQAAIGYLVYGVLYLAGAIYLGRIGKGPAGTAWWYLLGRYGRCNARILASGLGFRPGAVGGAASAGVPVGEATTA